VRYLQEYYLFIESNKGISPNLEELYEYVVNKIGDIGKCRDMSISLNFSSSKDKNRNINLSNLIININYQKGSKNICDAKSDFSNSKYVNDLLDGVIIDIYVFFDKMDKDFLFYIKSVLFHELLHVYQTHEIMKANKFKPESWRISLLLPSFRKFMTSNYVNYILDCIYFSLSHEIYAQIHQYYFYKKEGKEYKRIFDIAQKLKEFETKPLSDIENIEINNIKKYILESLKRDVVNKKYLNDISLSIWTEQNNDLFLLELKKLFTKRFELYNRKVSKIDKKLSISLEESVKESIDKWKSLPSNFDIMKLDIDFISDILSDIDDFELIPKIIFN